jgi:phage terminase large subunit-like protein
VTRKPVAEHLASLPRRQVTKLAEQVRLRRNKILTYYPETGKLGRKNYPKHMAFFRAGGRHEPMPHCPAGCKGEPHRQRLFLAGNRIGKTEGVGAFETTLHLTGRYPTWWTGKRFDHGIRAWAAGDTSKTVREIIQDKLLGPMGSFGTGMIPGEAIIGEPRRRSGLADSIEIVYVHHVSGDHSTLVLKSYDQRREAFQGTSQDLIWLDEEPPLDIYIECLMRTMTTHGCVLLTFTPLQGMSDVVLRFLSLEETDDVPPLSRFTVQAEWDDAPHLTDAVKKELLAEIPAYQRDARTKGIPQLGAGAIYPVAETDLVIDPFEIPAHWPRAFGLDVGWKCTAAVWGALDRDNDCLVLYSEHCRGEQGPAVHAGSIKARGAWIRGAIDPSARGRSQVDGRRLIEMYRDLGLDLTEADNTVETGIYRVLERMNTGRLKVFRTLPQWLGEFRLYRRDEKGRIVKERDHLMDGTRYLEMELLNICRTKPANRESGADWESIGPDGWML